MGHAIYQVRLKVQPEFEDEFNRWYEGEYIPKLMREVPHFTAVRRSVGVVNGERIYVTDYDTTVETMPLAIAEMRVPERAPDNAAFYAWKDRGVVTFHESLQLHERLRIEQAGQA